MEPLERFVEAFAANLSAPLIYDSGQAHFGFRYAKPDRRHFCLLKSIRAVSALNAAILLAQQGYCQEIAVLIRTIVECTSHIKYVMSDPAESGAIDAEIERYIMEYFSDFARNSSSDFRRPRVKQNAVHQVIGAELKKSNLKNDVEGRFTGVEPSKLFSNIYLTYSNYVHARYPEVMDMYGGFPGHFHLRGMRGMPKDMENLETLDAFVTQVSQTLKLLVMKLNLKVLVARDSLLSSWYHTN